MLQEWQHNIGLASPILRNVAFALVTSFGWFWIPQLKAAKSFRVKQMEDLKKKKEKTGTDVSNKNSVKLNRGISCLSQCKFISNVYSLYTHGRTPIQFLS